MYIMLNLKVVLRTYAPERGIQNFIHLNFGKKKAYNAQHKERLIHYSRYSSFTSFK